MEQQGLSEEEVCVELNEAYISCEYFSTQLSVFIEEALLSDDKLI